MTYLTWLLAILHVHKALCEETLWDTTVRLSETMTLECVYPLTDNLTQVEWTKNIGTKTVTIAVYNPSHNMHIDPDYLHRVHFLNSTVEFRNMSLTFHNASEADIGTYSCLFHAFPRGSWEKNIKVVQSGTSSMDTPENSQNVNTDSTQKETRDLEDAQVSRVEGGEVENTTSGDVPGSSQCSESFLFPNAIGFTAGVPFVEASGSKVREVLHPNSPRQVVIKDSFEIAAPLDSYLSAAPGQNVTLSCQLQRIWPVQQVIWEKVQPHQVDILASCNLSQGTRYTSKYLRQTWSNCSQGSMKSVLIIPYATAADSGLYRCRSEASMGRNKTFVIRLIITDGGTNKHFILPIVGGLASLVFVILIIFIIILYNRKRGRQVRTPLKEPRDKQSKVPTNCRSLTSPIQHTDDEKEDIYVNYPTFSRRPKLRF